MCHHLQCSSLSKMCAYFIHKTQSSFFELVNQWWIRFFIFCCWDFQKWFSVTLQFLTFAKIFNVFCRYQVVFHELCNLRTGYYKLLNLSTFEEREIFVAFPNQLLNLIPKWWQNIVKLYLKVTWKHLYKVSCVCHQSFGDCNKKMKDIKSDIFLKCNCDNPKCEAPKFFSSTLSAWSMEV